MKIFARILLVALGLFTFVGSSPWASAEIRPDKVRVADAHKTQHYLQDGLIVGGDRAIDGVVIKDIRRAPNAGFERVVIDLEGTQGGEPATIQRPPYYQIAVTPDEKRLVFTLWGSPKLAFNPKKVLASFKRSPVFKGLVLLPKLEQNTWTLVFDLTEGKGVEAFELSNPLRIIMDVRIK